MANPMDKLDRSIQDTERFIVIEQQVLQGSVAMAAAQRRSSKGGAESNTLIRQAELGIDQSKERLEFLRGQLEKKKRRRQGAPKVEEKKWTNQLDLIRSETPLSVPRISHMLNNIEFKLKLEDQFKQGREKMASALANPKDDKREKTKLLADQQESTLKIKLLKQALKKYNNLLCDEDEEDEDLKNPSKEAVARKPISGRLLLSLKSARDLEHAPLPSSRSSKYFNETTVEFKIHGNVKDSSHPSRTDRWLQDFDIEMDKADEVEIAFYDQQGGQKNPPPRVLIGVMWLKVSDLLEALRRQKVEGLDGDGPGWVTAATVRDRDGGSSGGRGGRNGDVDAPLGQQGGLKAGNGGQGGGGPSSSGHGGPSDGLDGWFNVEPQGAVNFHLDFVKENVRRRPLDAAGGLGRQGAVKKRKGEVHEMNGHKFIKRQFFQVILCALCNNLLRTGDGYQCEDCRYMCHEGCYRKVLTKCISKPNSEMENDEDKINHNIPHRFEPYSNITTNWCCHCGFLLPLGRKIPRKCTECSITCHEQCAHLVPNFCGMTMENANALIGMMQAVKQKTKTSDPSKRLPSSPSGAGRIAPPPHTHTPPDHQLPVLPHQHQHQQYQQQQQQHQHQQQHQQQQPSLPSIDRLSIDNHRQSPPSPGGYNADRERDYQNRLSQQQQPTSSYGPPGSHMPQQPSRGDRPLPQTPGVARPPPPPSPYDQPPPPSQYVAPPPPRSTDPYSRPPPPPQQPPQHVVSQPPRPPPQHPQAPPIQAIAPLATSRPRRSKIGLEDFNFLTVLGKGNFGKVMLAEEKKSNALYAIKVLKKEFIIENDEVDSTKSEKRVFLAAAERKHPFLLNLHSCFQTETRIYFVMEYVSGGDLMLHIQRKQFTFRQAKFYAAEVLLALEYFHAKGIIYRDLKLDNILLTVEGHIKVADYGLCKEDMWYGKTTSTFCGTPEFMAPEILMEQRYGRAVDWWAFGVLTYEMLLGQSPFRGDDEDEIFDAILEDPPLYPITMPPKAVMLLQGLLERDPLKRLGSGESDALEIKNHPFFADVDFDAVYDKKIPPTYFPNVKNAMDTTNFDSEFTNEQPTLTPVHGRLGAKDQEEFHGFSWIAPWASQT